MESYLTEVCGSQCIWITAKTVTQAGRKERTPLIHDRSITRCPAFYTFHRKKTKKTRPILRQESNTAKAKKRVWGQREKKLKLANLGLIRVSHGGGAVGHDVNA